MTELDLLNLARSATQNDVTWFSQMITITFAMVVAIYYFLNQAKIGLKIVAFVAYMVGMLVFLGEMLIETNVKTQALAALQALPNPSAPTRQLVGVTYSWLGTSTAVVFNASFWILWIGIFYLLFFWKKGAEQ
jgi:hypothetical protein